MKLSGNNNIYKNINKNKNNSEIIHLCKNIFPVIIGTILIWKGVLDIAEAYIPKKIHYDILCIVLGLIIIYKFKGYDYVV